MLTTDRAGGAALVLLALVVLLESRKLPLGTLHNPGPAYMPVALAFLLGLLGVLLVVWGGVGMRLAAVGWREWRHAVAILGACGFAALALEHLGYRVTMAITLAFLIGVVERKSIVSTAAFALALAFGSYFLFDTLLRVPLPRGPFGF